MDCPQIDAEARRGTQRHAD